MAPLGELEQGDGFETNVISDNQCGILVESHDTFSKEHSFDEPSVVEFSEVTHYVELTDLISDEFSLNLAPTYPVSPISFSLPFLLPSLDPP